MIVFKFFFLFAFICVLFNELSFKCSFTVSFFFSLGINLLNAFSLINTFCRDNKRDTMIQ